MKKLIFKIPLFILLAVFATLLLETKVGNHVASAGLEDLLFEEIPIVINGVVDGENVEAVQPKNNKGMHEY